MRRTQRKQRHSGHDLSAMAVVLLLVATLQLVECDYSRISRVSGQRKVSAQNLDLPQPSYCASPGSPPDLDTELGIFLPLVVTSAVFLPPTFPAGATGAATLYGAAWNALTAYHPTANPVSNTGIPRRPASEHTRRNRNIAIAYAVLRVAERTGPAMAAFVRAAIEQLGLDVTDGCVQDLSKAACIGNKAAAVMMEQVDDTGINLDGCVGRQSGNCQRFDDYTGFEPTNTAYRLNDPFAWQPLRETSQNGYFTVQEFYFPYFGSTTTPLVLPKSVLKRRARYQRPNKKKYKAQVEDVLQASVRLGRNETLKVIAELFDNPGYAVRTSIALMFRNGWDLPTALAFWLQNLASFDAGSVMIREKRRLNAVRPLSAVRYVYGDLKIEAYAGPKMGVTWLPGNEWTPYMRTAPEPEFPSGAVCICTLFAEWVEGFTGSKSLGVTLDTTKGCSFREPFITPSTNISITFATTDDLVKACQEARIAGGMHFPQATKEAKRLCTGLARAGLQWLKQLLPSLNLP